jgi:lipopolysaccharide transport system permease protein
VQPVVAAGTFTMLRRQGVFETEDAGVPYAAFALVGTLVWQAFVDSLNGPLRMVSSSRDMLVKLNFPREALVVAGLLAALTNSAARLLVLLPLGFYYGWTLSARQLLFLPGLAATMLVGMAFGLLLVPLGMLYKDIEKGLGFVLTFWMFITPVVFPVDKATTAFAMRLNPVTPVLDTTRAWLLGLPGDPAGLLMVTGAACGALAIGWLLFRLALPHVVARLGS